MILKAVNASCIILRLNASNKIASQTTTISELEKHIFLLNLQIYDMAALNLRLTEEINANKCKINVENTSSY